MVHNKLKPCYYWFPLLFILACFVAPSWSETEAEILLRFKDSLANYGSQLDDWNGSGPGPCDNPNWTGVRCFKGSVFGLKLENMGLTGVIDVNILTGLQLLRTVSFMNNSFGGPFPEVKKLTSLRALYLAYNHYSGEIRNDGFTGMPALQRVFLAWNNFSGSIPKSLATLPSLFQLSLEQNHFEGRIPDFQQDFKQDGSFVNLAYNKLEGPIPYSLRKMNASFFERRAPGEPGLDWPTRLKIIKGVAKGLAYLYNELSNLTLPHGHLKSSNVLLNHTFDPLLSDYALLPVMNKEHAQQFMVAYKSPEFSQYDRTTRKTDVWSLGILILEMLTGKFPANYLRQGKGGNADLATWVNSVVREEWTGEVFDKDMKGTKNGEGEMLKLLKIGMCCCEWDIEKRWELREALERIEELKERDSDNVEDYSSYGSEGDVYSSRAVTDDEFSFSNNLCGEPLPKCSSSRKKRTIIIIIVVAGSLVVLALIAAVSYILKDPAMASRFKKAEKKKPAGNVIMGKKEVLF
ncbi:hypothetical protein GOBAR_DD01901 [Gossypium barbadense]|nr:hypothetical protein GOBAR_DD01901 [Gossypium barbadense]